MDKTPCEECHETHAEPTKCGGCLYANVKRQIRDEYWPIVECKCGHRQVWD